LEGLNFLKLEGLRKAKNFRKNALKTKLEGKGRMGSKAKNVGKNG